MTSSRVGQAGLFASSIGSKSLADISGAGGESMLPAETPIPSPAMAADADMTRAIAAAMAARRCVYICDLLSNVADVFDTGAAHVRRWAGVALMWGRAGRYIERYCRALKDADVAVALAAASRERDLPCRLFSGARR